MKHAIMISLYLGSIFSAAAQIKNVAEKFALPDNLNESSGAIFFNDKLVTHNDSGGENKLFELDTISGLVTRTVTISNATNVDWEDITQDNTSIYIGDIGNNNGNRTNLKIYKINKNDYINNNSVTAETIAYSYADQTDFTSSPNNTTWDAEALISFDANNLIVFTKNWVDGITKGYLVPKTSVTYLLDPLETTLNSGGLISGGTFNNLTDKLYLIGYTNFLQPFVWVSEGFTGNDVFSGSNNQTSLYSVLSSEQVEAIAFVDANRYFITSESFTIFSSTENAKAITFSANDTTLSIENKINKQGLILYPNPVEDILYFNKNNIDSIEIYDTKMAKIYEFESSNVDMSQFSKGIYFIKVNTNDKLSTIQKIVKN